MPAVDVVIIGGGAVGLSTAYHLGRAGGYSVRLYERNELSSGTSWHAAGIVGPLRGSPNLTQLAMYATELIPRLEDETGQLTGYRQTGGYWLAQTDQRLVELGRLAAMGKHTGLSLDIISPTELASAVPFLRTDDLIGALRVKEDGQVNPVDLCTAYAAGARRSGVIIEEHCGVERIITKNSKVTGVTLEDGRRISCNTVALCTGAWSRNLAMTAGVCVPLQAVEHMYVITEPMSILTDPVPILRDMDSGIYLKGDTGKLVFGGFEPNAKPWYPESEDPKASFLMFDEDWDQFMPFMQSAVNRIPALEHAGIQKFMNGPESFTPDTRPLMGESPEVANLYVAAGYNSTGIMSSPGAGRILAEWMINGHPPQDMWEVDIARTDPKWSESVFLTERMREAVYNLFAIHWPLKQPETGRKIRCSALHDRLESAGGVFGSLSNWERPLWYAESDEEREIVYTFDEQPWWPIARREAVRMTESVALVELSPFTKIDVSGAGSLGALQYFCSGNMEMAVGNSRYTVMLNERGGIEADITVTRCESDRFRVISGAATRFRDFARMRRLLKGRKSVSIVDSTCSESVIGIMGPSSRTVISLVSDEDWSNEAFPFASTRQVKIAGKPVLAIRRSFVGELGWEFYVANEHTSAVYDALRAAGTGFGMAHLGHLALDGCRLEKRFGHWGHEWGPHVTPLEAGIESTVSKDKSDYLGYEALERQRQSGVKQRLVLFEVARSATGPPLLLHDEPVMVDDEFVGLTTSGGLGPRTLTPLAFAMVECEPGESIAEICDKPYSIDVAETLHAAQILTEAPYDPDGMRMRG